MLTEQSEEIMSRKGYKAMADARELTQVFRTEFKIPPPGSLP